MSQRYSDMKFQEVDESIYRKTVQLISTRKLSVSPPLPREVDSCVLLAGPKWVLTLPIDNAKGSLSEEYLKLVPFSIPICVSYKYLFGEVNEQKALLIVIDDPLAEKRTEAEILDDYDEGDIVATSKDTDGDKLPDGYPIKGHFNFNLVKYIALNPKPRILKIFAKLDRLHSIVTEIELRSSQ